MAVVDIHTWIRSEILTLGESYVYIGSYNDDYDNIVSIRFYDSNIDDEVSFGNHTVARYPYLQVMVRDISHENAYTRMRAIQDYFSVYKHQVLTMIPKSSIMHLGNDHRQRTVLTLNFKLMLLEGDTITTV